MLIYDNAIDWRHLRYMLPAQTRCTIFITTRNRDLYRHLQQGCRDFSIAEISLEHFTDNEAIALFQQMLAEDFKAEQRDIYLGIARNLGFLPLALRQAISLMIYAPHYTARQLLDKLNKEDRLALLRKGQSAEGSDSRAIETVFDFSSPLLTEDLIETMEYLAVCAPGPTPLSFLRGLSGNEAIDENLEQLHTFCWCDRRELEAERHYELHQLVRELVRKKFGLRFSHNFIGQVHQLFTDENTPFFEKEPLITQLYEALSQAVASKDHRLKDWLYDLYDFCTYRGYMEFYVRLTEHVERLLADDKWTMRTVYAHRALILRRWGKLDQAMALHQKQEQIKSELGDRAGLAICWWNQGIIYGIKGNKKKKIELWRKSIEMNKAIGIPTEEDEKALEEL